MTGDLADRDEGERGLDLVLLGDEETIDEVHSGRLDRDGHLARPGHGVGTLLDSQDGRWSQLIADGSPHGRQR